MQEQVNEGFTGAKELILKYLFSLL